MIINLTKRAVCKPTIKVAFMKVISITEKIGSQCSLTEEIVNKINHKTIFRFITLVVFLKIKTNKLLIKMISLVTAKKVCLIIKSILPNI